MTQPQYKDDHYKYADYLAWDDGKRYELIDGVAYALASPTRIHQEISMAISLQIGNFLKGKTCKVYSAPFDVRLNADADDDTVVQPDITVVCDRTKLYDKGCKGAPDMVIEILSPSTARIDKHVKFQLYQRSGIREYWIVDPDSRTVQVHILNDGHYYTTSYGDTDTAPVHVLEGCTIALQDVFADAGISE